MAVDVVVVNYKTPELLQDFVDSYRAFSWDPCTLTIVDVECGRDYYDSSVPGLFRIGSSLNLGYARACNAGAKCGINDVILLANADTRLSPDFKLCHDELLDHHDWGVLGPRQVNAENRITAGGIFGTDRAIGQRGWNAYDNGQYSDIREDAMSVSGSLYFIKRLVWEQMTRCSFMQEAYPGIEGAFIPTPHYYEETCCSYHVRAHGYKVVYYGPAKMFHHWHRSHPIGSDKDRRAEESKEMMRSFLTSHHIVCE